MSEQPLGTRELGSGFPFSDSVEQTGYCSQADLERKITKRTLAELTNDAFVPGKNNDGAEPDPDVVQQMIAEADQDIDSIVGTRYAVPFAQGSIPDSIKFLSLNMAAFYCFRRKLGANKISKEWQRVYDDCMKELQSIAAGEQTIGVDPAFSSGVVTPPTANRQTDFFNSSNPISQF